jgi:hypothetical protein
MQKLVMVYISLEDYPWGILGMAVTTAQKFGRIDAGIDGDMGK